MPEAPQVVPPLKLDGKRRPLLYSTLTAYFQLEELEPNDEARLEQANAIVADWFGGKLRWTGASVTETVEPFSLTDFELISCHVRNLEVWSPEANDDSDARAFDYDHDVAAIDEYEVALHAGAYAGEASPWSYRFF